MKTSTLAFHWLARLSGLAQILMGIAIWTGRDSVIPLHRVIGFVFVFSLWALALLAARAGVARGLAILAFLWGLLMPALGLTQALLLPGGTHWTIQILHLVVGLAGIGQAEALARRTEGRLGAPQRAWS